MLYYLSLFDSLWWKVYLLDDLTVSSSFFCSLIRFYDDLAAQKNTDELGQVSLIYQAITDVNYFILGLIVLTLALIKSLHSQWVEAIGEVY